MRSLTMKLTLAFLLVGLTGSVLVAIFIQYRTRSAFDQFILTRDQQVLVNFLVEYYQSNGSWNGVGNNIQSILEASPRYLGDLHDPRRNGTRFTLIGDDNRVIFSLLPGQVGEVVKSNELRNAIPLKVGGNTAGWLLQTSPRQDWIPNSPEGLFLRNVTRATLFSALIAAALALILGGFLAFTLTSSLRELTEATVQIARGKLGMQVKVRSKDELGELATSFNKMSLDLERATQARRQMTADIAHDLRSPLSVISGYAEALSDGKLPGTPEAYAILHQETKHLSRLVDDLRTLSLADAGELPLILQAVSPQTILERVAARHAVAARQMSLTLRVEAAPDLPLVSMDVERMAQVFDNLVINAFRYSPAGGEVVLVAKAINRSVVFQVHDNGSGIDPDDLPHIFDRFYRGDKSRQLNGESGLGLAIARSIVEAHGGKISAESTPGQGTLFTIFLQT